MSNEQIFLKLFQLSTIILNHGPIIWPSRSPMFTPPDYRFWESLKKYDINGLRESMTNSITITDGRTNFKATK